MCRWECYAHEDGGMGECVTMLSVCQCPCETGCDREQEEAGNPNSFFDNSGACEQESGVW